MNLQIVKLDVLQANSLIDDVEINPEEPLHILLPKILQRAGKPLHFRDLEYVVVNKEYYQIHKGKVPKDTARPLFAVLRKSNGIHKISKGIYGLTEWQNAASEVFSNEEIDLEAQAIQQDSSIIYDSVEELNNEEKNCPICSKKIDIKLHFCTVCGADLSGFCKSCLYKLKDNWIFCGNCGMKLESRIKKSNYA